MADSRSYRRDRSDTHPGAVTPAPTAGASGYAAGDWPGLETAAYPRSSVSGANYMSAPTGPYPPPGYPARGGRADHLIMDSYAMPAQPGSAPVPPPYTPDPRSAGYGSHTAAAGYPVAEPGTAGYPSQPPPTASYGHDSGGYSSAATAAFPAGSDPAEAPPGYPAYGATGPIGPASSGQHVRPADIPYPPAGYGPVTSGQDAYSGQFPSYSAHQPAFGHSDPPLYASPYDTGGYVQAVQPAGGYASADPYASDPYGYRGYGR